MYAALLDACVLHPWLLCHVELTLAEIGLFRPVWSDDILEETKRSILRRRPDLEEATIERRMQAMRYTFEDAIVPAARIATELASVPESVPEHDRHVVAAALAGRADVIVTANLDHFPSDDLIPLGLIVQSPDDFLIDQWHLDPATVADAIVGIAVQTRRPPLAPDTVLEILAKSAPKFVTVVRATPEWADASAGLEQPPGGESAGRLETDKP